MLTRNFFPQIKKFVDLKKYEEFINEKIEFWHLKLFKEFELVSLEKLNHAFWELYDELKPFNPLNWYDLCSICIIKSYSPDILLKDGKIILETQKIQAEWLKYLTKRIIQNQSSLPHDFFEKLASDAPLPIPDMKSMETLLEDNVDLINHYDLLDVLHNPDYSPIKKIKIFREYYVSYFELFNRRCQYIEKNLAQKEGRTCLKKLHDIFQLNNDNERRPPEYARNALKIIIHVRNACTHRNITVISENLVLIRDFKPNTNEITYEDRRTIPQLYEYYYILIALDRAFGIIALLILLLRHLINVVKQSGKYILCHKCGRLDHYIFNPDNDILVCNNCKWPHDVKDLRYIGGI